MEQSLYIADSNALHYVLSLPEKPPLASLDLTLEKATSQMRMEASKLIAQGVLEVLEAAEIVELLSMELTADELLSYVACKALQADLEIFLVGAAAFIFECPVLTASPRLYAPWLLVGVEVVPIKGSSSPL